MPREITVLAQAPHDLHALARAAEGIEGAAEIREIDGGAALQVIGPDHVEVLTVYPPRRVSCADEVARLLPDAPEVSVPLWWTDAFAPWGPEGEAGVSIALRLALGLDAVCVVED
ncbi:hypothetical protein AS850_10385 [Frondihabitans sp. 762G35]|uniref:hypothetical protein n=1 Tax=Frondihabitans sp. 762G35 TaxID=1446794 RepID=UPI000D201316|nr:hypothetical protein [Frondihabitans sp. 762G35]ARC57483.1 hypothetical protein AS850_10385 [Frondihabitans sp. 762G35]